MLQSKGSQSWTRLRDQTEAVLRFVLPPLLAAVRPPGSRSACREPERRPRELCEKRSPLLTHSCPGSPHGRKGSGPFRRSSHPAGRRARGAAPLRGRQRCPDLVTLDTRARAGHAGLLGHITCFSGSGHARLAHTSVGCSRGRTRAPPGKHQGSPGGRTRIHLGDQDSPGGRTRTHLGDQELITWGTKTHLGAGPRLPWGLDQDSPGGQRLPWGTKTHLEAGPGLTWGLDQDSSGGSGITWGTRTHLRAGPGLT